MREMCLKCVRSVWCSVCDVFVMCGVWFSVFDVFYNCGVKCSGLCV